MYLLTDWVRRINFDKLREERQNTLQEKIGKHGLDALIAFRVENMKYATDIHPSWFPSVPIRNGAIVKKDGPHPVCFVASGNWRHRLATTYWVDPKHIYPMPLMESRAQVEKTIPNLTKAFETLGIHRGRIGVDLITMDIYDALRKILPQAEFVPGEDCINDAKLKKNEEEIKCLGVSSYCVEVAMEVAKGAVEMGKREGEILGEGMYEMYRFGMQMPQGMPFVASGEENLSPLFRFASDRFVREGDLVVLSFGGYFNGMFAEMKRTVVCGKANPEQKKIYGSVRRAMEAALGVMKPGASSQKVFNKVKGVFQKDGYGSHAFKYPLAHGIGVGGWEPPFIEADSPNFVLEPGMTFSLEPTLVVPKIPGGGTVALGSIVAIREGGNEVLTEGSYDDRLQ